MKLNVKDFEAKMQKSVATSAVGLRTNGKKTASTVIFPSTLLIRS